VFEIGSSLRGAREHQKLELSDVERETRIRARYIKALEDDQFDVLPGAAYAKGFLRTYADFLGLDAQRFLDEYNTHFAPTEAPEAPPPVRIKRPHRLLDARLVAVPLALAIGLFVWQVAFGSGGGQHHHVAYAPPLPRVAARTTAPERPATAAPRPTTARITLTAARGPCWMSVRLGSATGTSVYERTLQQGETVRFTGTSLWMRLGAPWNLEATLNGKPAQLPAAIGDVIVSPSAVRIVGG
jgi:cytoskeleton protein RodZ